MFVSQNSHRIISNITSTAIDYNFQRENLKNIAWDRRTGDHCRCQLIWILSWSNSNRSRTGGFLHEFSNNKYTVPHLNIFTLNLIIRDPISGDQSWGNTTPSQSKSFRILQQITDTIDLLDKVDEEHCAQAQPPQFARQMDANEQQLRRMQMNEGKPMRECGSVGSCVALIC